MRNGPRCGKAAKGTAGSSFAVRAMYRVPALVFLFALVPATSGCSRPSPDSESPQLKTPPPSPSAEQASNAPPSAQNSSASAPEMQILRETWDAIFMGDAKVGYLHTRTQQYEEDDQPRHMTKAHLEISAQRFGQVTTPQISFGDIVKPEGGLLQFSSRLHLGSEPILTSGVVTGDQLRKETQSSGERNSQEVTWDASWGGYFAPEKSLREQPMRPGEQRTIQHLKAPPFNIPGETLLVAEDFEETRLLDGTRRLLKVKNTETFGATRIESYLWVDEQGEVLKQHMPSMQQTSYRTTREVALGESQTIDLGERLAVRLGRTIADPHATRRIVYRARLPQGDPASVFDPATGQSIESIDSNTALLDVRAVRPDEPGTAAAEQKVPSDADRMSNTWIQSSHPQVIAMSRSVAGQEQDPWKIACALEQLVERLVENKNFSQAFATAADVAETREGDCTEHAVLLAALLRAREIPARVAIGLVYFPISDGGAMAYHMWTEAWIGDRWIPLDGTLGRCGIGAAHLKLADSHLGGDDALLSYLEVNEVLGQLELEVIRVE